MATNTISNKQTKFGPSNERLYFFDDFIGRVYNGYIWNSATTGSASSSISWKYPGGQVRLRAGTAESALLDWNNNYSISSQNCEIIFSVRRPVENATTEVGLNSATGQIRFVADPWDSWYAETDDGTDTSTNTSVSAIDLLRVLRIVVGTTDVKFYVNHALKATHTTNIPDGPFEPYISQIGGQADQDVLIDYVQIYSERD